MEPTNDGALMARARVMLREFGDARDAEDWLFGAAGFLDCPAKERMMAKLSVWIATFAADVARVAVRRERRMCISKLHECGFDTAAFMLSK